MYKEIFNLGIDYVKSLGIDSLLPSEVELSKKWKISRTTVRAVLTHLVENDIISWQGRKKNILRLPKKTDYFAHAETISKSETVETQFMEYILGGDLKPGAIIRESELVREFGASTSVVREFLNLFSRFGLIEKKPNRHWVLRGFTREFAVELFDMREMFEDRALKNLLSQDSTSKLHQNLLDLEKDHLKIIDDIETEYLNFPRLDERFHRVIVSDLKNRFIDDFFELVSVIFHYHYRWNKRDEKERNFNAAHQHLAIIQAVKADDHEKIISTFEHHIADARLTLLNSIAWDNKE